MRYTPRLLAGSALSLALLGCGGDVAGNDAEGVDAEPTAPVATPGPSDMPGVVPGGGGAPAVAPPGEPPAAVTPGVVPTPVPDPVLPPPTPEATATATPEPVAPPMESLLGTGVMGGSGMSSDRYAKADVTRDGQNYFFMANGWGPGFGSQSVTWNGTSFTIVNMEGETGPNYEPATYPTVFCGRYSSEVSKECGLPAPLASITSIRTGWRWAPNGNTGQYNAAYDIWMGDDDGNFSGFLMVWLREPVGQQPAGSMQETSISVANVPGTWHIWSGFVYETVPIVNWVRKTGSDSTELEFDVMDFVRDAQTRGYELPGTTILAIAVGFEIWQGPVANLESQDFYIDVQ